MNSLSRTRMMAKRKIPRFLNEQEEASWWDRNRTELDKDFVKAGYKGQLKRLDKAALRKRVAANTKIISLRMLEDDLALAREQAAAERSAVPDIPEVAVA